jgi:hypothetical protein
MVVRLHKHFTVETQQCVQCVVVVDLHFIVKYIKIFSVGKKGLHGKFMSPATMQIILPVREINYIPPNLQTLHVNSAFKQKKTFVYRFTAKEIVMICKSFYNSSDFFVAIKHFTRSDRINHL